MFEGFPYTNFHELNLDWIIKIAKDFLDQYTNIQQTITQGLEDLDTKAQQLQALLDAWYEEHSEDIANQLAAALQDLNDWYTQHQGYLDQYLTDSITAFGVAADAKAAQTIESIPADYTTLANDVDNLEEVLSYSVSSVNMGLDLALKNGYTISVVDGAMFTQGFWDANNVFHVSSNRIATDYIDNSIVAIIVPSGWYARLGILNISTGVWSLQNWDSAITNNNIFFFDHTQYKYKITVCKTNLDADVAINDCYNIALVINKIPISKLSYSDAKLDENSFVIRSFDWSQGEINANGQNASSMKGIRTGSITFNGNALFLCDKGYSFVVFEYVNGSYTGIRTGNDNRFLLLYDSEKKYRIVLKRDYSDYLYDSINVSEASHLHIYDFAVFEKKYYNILRIGDSLTAQQSASELAGYVLRDVNNFGIGGETSLTIAGRCGAVPMYVNNIIIPVDETAVQIQLTSDYGPIDLINPTDAKAGINPCSIAGIWGTISKNNGNLFFTPTGTRTATVPIQRPTAVITNLSKEKSGILILWAGTNDGTTLNNADTIIRNLDYIIESVNPEKYIVLSWLVSTPQSDIYDCNDKLLQHYGKHFLNVHKYCQDYGLADAGLTPTAEDTIFINAGYIPYFLLNDSVHPDPETVHPNATGRTVIMKCIARKLRDLGYITIANA